MPALKCMPRPLPLKWVHRMQSSSHIFDVK
jgi:hypothetical protein